MAELLVLATTAPERTGLRNITKIWHMSNYLYSVLAGMYEFNVVL